MLDNDSNLTSDDFQTSCALNKFFASVFTTEQAGPLPSLTHTDGVIPEARLSAFNITCEDVSNVIHRLNANSSPGPDNIPNRLLIESHDVILPSITRFFNNLLRSDTIPNDWKKSNIVAIHKKGYLTLPNNYRPISLTSSLCKILERNIHNKMLSFLQQHNICLLYTSPSPRDLSTSRMPSSA